ncbi:unnamed protein product [Calypogeia fissa]
MLVQFPVRLVRYGVARDLWKVPMVQQWRVYTNLATDSGSVSYLRSTRTGVEIYLVGTAHVSQKSAEEVYQVIHQVIPETVAVELCPERAKKLMAGEQNETQTFLRSLAELLQAPGGVGQKVVNFTFKSIYAMLRNTGLEPGKEFKVACEEAQKLGAKLLYIDQDYRVTIQRVVEVMTYKDVFRLLTSQGGLPPELRQEFESGSFEEALEKVKTRENVRAVVKSMEALFPNLVKVMIHERDKLMVERLRECTGKVVGVVGMAHMDGIERLWKELES